MDLYRFYDKAGQLLYVGISLHAAVRAMDHRRDKTWWPLVSRIDVKHYRSKGWTKMLVLEQRAIETERPLFNVMMSGVRRRPVPLSLDAALAQVREQLPPPRLCVKVSELADLLGCDRNSVYNRINRGEIAALRFGGSVRVGVNEAARLVSELSCAALQAGYEDLDA